MLFGSQFRLEMGLDLWRCRVWAAAGGSDSGLGELGSDGEEADGEVEEDLVWVEDGGGRRK